MLVLVVVLLAYGCPAKEAAKAPSVVKVDEVTFSKEQLKEEMDGLPDYLKTVFAGSGGVDTFVEEVAKREVLTQEARKAGLDKDKEYLKKLADFERNALINMLLTKNIGEKVKVTDEEVKDYYDKNVKEFTVSKKVKASHILVKTEAEAQDVIKKLGKGAKFDELAKKLSDDKGSALNGGDLGFFAAGEMLPEFEKVAFSLEKGKLSAPVNTKYGYHVIMVTDVKTDEVIEFDKVKNMVRQKLSGNKQKQVFENYYAGIKKNHKVDIDPKMLGEFKSMVTAAVKPAPAAPGVQGRDIPMDATHGAPPAEAVKTEAPADAKKAEAPADAKKAEAPADAKKAEAPADAKKAETPADVKKTEPPAKK
jgi:peptidyl-prolyl cis-trans isomerase C